MIGQTISHYRILGKLGGGGMGVVYEAEDTRLGRHVAIKFLPDNLTGDRKAMERFEREARAASLLNHPSICTIHEVEDHNGHPFIVMEKLEGESLKQRIRGKAMDIDELLDVARPGRRRAVRLPRQGHHSSRHQAGEHLPYHQRADQGPRLRTGQTAARRALATSEDTPVEDSLTAVGVIPGTAVYMSPEQARSEELDPRTDLFSFGVVLYEMATGKKPFSGNNVVTTLDAVLHTKPPSPLTLNPDVPRELEGIIGFRVRGEGGLVCRTASRRRDHVVSAERFLAGSHFIRRHAPKEKDRSQASSSSLAPVSATCKPRFPGSHHSGQGIFYRSFFAGGEPFITQKLGQSKVEDFGLPAGGEEDVRGFDVAMNDALRMGGDRASAT